MGKKQKKKYRYTKHEFINICCDKCGICDKGASPELCYFEFYRKDPKKFIKKVFKNLLINSYLMCSEIHFEYAFKNSFCNANICGNYISPTNSIYHEQCRNINECMRAFKQQVKGQHLITPFTAFTGVKRYVVQPYPTFFTNDSDTFREEIKKIVAAGK